MICCARLTAAACGQLESVTLLHQGWSNGQVTWRVTRTSNIHLTSNGRWSAAGPCWQLRHYDGHRGAGLYFTHFCSIGCCHYSLMKHQPFTSFTFSNPSHKVTTFDSLVILNRLNTTKVQKVCVAGSWIFLSVDCFIFFHMKSVQAGHFDVAAEIITMAGPFRPTELHRLRAKHSKKGTGPGTTLAPAAPGKMCMKAAELRAGAVMEAYLLQVAWKRYEHEELIRIMKMTKWYKKTLQHWHILKYLEILLKWAYQANGRNDKTSRNRSKHVETFIDFIVSRFLMQISEQNCSFDLGSPSNH